MLKPGGDLNLTREALTTDDAGEIGRQDFYRHPASVAQITREVDDRHSATAKLALDRITVVNDSGELVRHVGQDSSGTIVAGATTIERKLPRGQRQRG